MRQTTQGGLRAHEKASASGDFPPDSLLSLAILSFLRMLLSLLQNPVATAWFVLIGRKQILAQGSGVNNTGVPRLLLCAFP